MNQYLFVLGRKAEISTQEIKSVFQDKNIIEQNQDFLLLLCVGLMTNAPPPQL